MAGSGCIAVKAECHRCATNSPAPLYASPARSSRWKSSVLRTAHDNCAAQETAQQSIWTPTCSAVPERASSVSDTLLRTLEEEEGPVGQLGARRRPVSLQFFLKDSSSVRPRQTPAHGTRGEKHGPRDLDGTSTGRCVGDTRQLITPCVGRSLVRSFTLPANLLSILVALSPLAWFSPLPWHAYTPGRPQ